MDLLKWNQKGEIEVNGVLEMFQIPVPQRNITEGKRVKRILMEQMMKLLAEMNGS